ncbi:MAG: hypothetical protein J7K73_02905 [Nanoarchaeota archaeon]|nr:hypothetical protein [Nanoarchaeota archaeon]
MRSLNIGIFGNDLELMQKVAKVFGKEGTKSDITLYNHKSCGLVVTTILPHTYPDKIQTLFYTIYLCDFPILVVGEINKGLGEVILSLDAANFDKGFIFAKDYVLEQLKDLIKGTSLEKYETFEFTDDNSINELRIKAFEVEVERKNDAKPYMFVDHSFVVKGVGTVVLSILKGGSIKVYDKLLVLPAEKETTIKSIQKHDENYKEAFPGDRVGLNLKDLKVDDVPRGALLSNFGRMAKKARIKLNVTKFLKEPIKTNQVLSVVIGMNYTTFKVEVGDVHPGEENWIVCDFEKPVAFMESMKVFVVNPNLKMRFVGFGEIQDLD